MLQLQDIEFWYSEETGPENLKDDCCPGKPHIHFTKGIILGLDNPQPHSGMYSRTLLIEDKTSAQTVIDKLKIQLQTLGNKVINRKFFKNIFVFRKKKNETNRPHCNILIFSFLF